MLSVARGTTNPITSVLNRFIPWGGSASSPDELFRAQLVCGISVAFGTSSMFFMVQTAFDPRMTGAITTVCGVACFMYACNLMLLRKRERLAWASQLLLGEMFVLLWACAALTTGAQFYNTAWQLCIPLFAVFLIGPRKALLIAAMMALTTITFYVMEVTGVFVPPYANAAPDMAMSLTSSLLGLGVTVAIGTVHDRAHQARRKALADTIDELRRTHEELKLAQRQLINAEKLSSIGMLAAGIAHEINNPMAFVKANLNGLQRDLELLLTDPEVRREYVEEVIPATVDGVARVNAIVADLRSFARGDTEKFVEYDVNGEIKTVARMAKSVVQRRGSQLEVELGQLPKVHGRPRQLMQVVMNLVVNAAQANGSGGKVKVTTRAARDEVAIEVRDTGVGMSEETLSKLFQPFFTTKPLGEGTGLGLAVVHGIVTGVGGRIDVRSELGKGSSFTVWLPSTQRAETAL